MKYGKRISCGSRGSLARHSLCPQHLTPAKCASYFATATCTGVDANSIRISTPGTTLTVASGASVTNTGAPAITVDVPRGQSYSAANTIVVAGSVAAPGQNAIAVFSGAPGASPYYYSSKSVALTVAAGGSVSGATALALLASPGNANGTVSASDDNAGTLTGTGGIALLGAAATSGSLTFGSGDDILYARYVGTRALATGVTGAVNGGGGTNTERVVFAADTSVTTPIDLNTGFQRLVLAPAAGVTATLGSGFSTSTSLVLSGTGTVVNRATIALAGPAVGDLDYAFGSSAAFRNEGSITASALSGYQYGLTFSNHSFTNSGAIAANSGGGVSMSYNPVNNSGSISATGTGVNLFDGALTNSGFISSIGGAGVNLYGNVGYTGSNSGTIRGATTGAITGIYLTNTGRISSAGTGVAVQPYGYLINAAGGVVNGGGGAVTAYGFNAGVANAGTINGNVVYSYGDASLTYFALPGGTLNGNLALSGGTLVTNLVNTGPGQFAGITGAVTASPGAALRYAVGGDTTTALPTGPVGPFASTGYQLSNGAALTLTAPVAQILAQTLLLAGNGSLDLNAAIAVTNGAAIQSTSAITYPGQTAATGGLSITSRGAITTTRTSNSPSYTGAVSLFSTDSFTNAGTIAVTDRLGQGAAAIYGGASVTNAGRITLAGGVGIAAVAAVSNTGTITQTGGFAATGVTGFTSFTNTGTVNVGGSAAQFGSYYLSGGQSLTNAGALTSTGGAAITNAYYGYGYSPQITNQAGGAITGRGRAIQLSGGVLTNAGAITGTVDIGYAGSSGRAYASSAYIAAGGTIAGDLLFGDAPDLLLQTGDALGVSG